MGLFQGLDTIPGEIIRDDNLRALFKRYLPGWSNDGIYNFQAGAATQKIAAQLEIPLQNGSHPWINDTIKDLFKNKEANARWVAAGPLLQMITKHGAERHSIWR